MAINIQPELDIEVATWQHSHDFRIPALVGADPEKLEKDYGVTGAPETFLLDPSGKILFRHIGFTSGDERTLEIEVRILLGLEPFELPRSG